MGGGGWARSTPYLEIRIMMRCVFDARIGTAIAAWHLIGTDTLLPNLPCNQIRVSVAFERRALLKGTLRRCHMTRWRRTASASRLLIKQTPREAAGTRRGLHRPSVCSLPLLTYPLLLHLFLFCLDSRNILIWYPFLYLCTVCTEHRD